MFCSQPLPKGSMTLLLCVRQESEAVTEMYCAPLNAKSLHHTVKTLQHLFCGYESVGSIIVNSSLLHFKLKSNYGGGSQMSYFSPLNEK